MSLLQWFGRKHREKLAEIKRLAASEDIRSVGALSEALSSRDSEVRRIAETALIRLLPRLTSDDADLLNTEQRRYLNRALDKTNPALSIPILKVWEIIGDEEALPYVEKLLRPKPKKKGENPLGWAAWECSKKMRRRFTDHDIRITLLRPSDPPAIPESMLREAPEA